MTSPAPLRRAPPRSRRWRVAALGATLLLMPPTGAGAHPGPAQTAATLAATYDDAVAQRWIDMLQPSDDGLIVIPVELNGQVEQAIVDTGAPYMMIDTARARELGLALTRWGPGQALGGKAEFWIAPVRSKAIGGFSQAGGQIVVGDLSALRPATPQRFTMIVGAEFLKQVAVQIDFDHNRVRFLPIGFRLPGASVLPLAIEVAGDRFVTHVTIDRQMIDRAAIDLGDNAALAIDPGIFAALPTGERVTDVMSAGMGGRFVSDRFHATHVALGDRSLHDIQTDVTSEILPDARGPPSRARIGLALLRNFNLVIDARAGHVELARRLRPPPPATVSTSGVQGIYADDGLTVAHAMRGSPAALAGIKDGDRICRVDGKTVDASWDRGQRLWSIGPAGTRVALSMCDGRELSITLARFY